MSHFECHLSSDGPERDLLGAYQLRYTQRAQGWQDALAISQIEIDRGTVRARSVENLGGVLSIAVFRP